jgi:hypothetical protein
MKREPKPRKRTEKKFSVRPVASCSTVSCP